MCKFERLYSVSLWPKPSPNAAIDYSASPQKHLIGILWSNDSRFDENPIQLFRAKSTISQDVTFWFTHFRDTTSNVLWIIFQNTVSSVKCSELQPPKVCLVGKVIVAKLLTKVVCDRSGFESHFCHKNRLVTLEFKNSKLFVYFNSLFLPSSILIHVEGPQDSVQTFNLNSTKNKMVKIFAGDCTIETNHDLCTIVVQQKWTKTCSSCWSLHHTSLSRTLTVST